MITVTVFLRNNCPECEQVQADLQMLQQEIPHQLVTIDIESDPDLREQFEGQVPQVKVGPYQLRWPIQKQDLKVAMMAAQQRADHLQTSGSEQYQKRVERGKRESGMDRVVFWISGHYMLVINLALFIYVGLPFLAPVLMKVGAELPARGIYALYKPFCHELAYRSFFLFGEQTFYPRQLAHIQGVISYEQAIDANADPYFARDFAGNETVGYKVALCQRDIALYGSLLLAGILFSLLRRYIHPIPLLVWVILGVIPIGLDGGSQYISAFGFLSRYFPARESTPFLRVLTGFLFGTFTAWFMFPLIKESMQEMRGILARKFAIIRAQQPPV